jgi:hypothetical protein
MLGDVCRGGEVDVRFCVCKGKREETTAVYSLRPIQFEAVYSLRPVHTLH